MRKQCFIGMGVRRAWLPTLWLIGLMALAAPAWAGDLEMYSYTPNFLSQREQVLVNERWKSMDKQAARSRLLIEQAIRACNQGAYQQEMAELKSQLDLMMDIMRREDPKQAEAMEYIFLNDKPIPPVEEAGLNPEADIMQFHAYFYNRLFTEQASLSQQCIKAPDTVMEKPTLSQDEVQQSAIEMVEEVHKMTTYMEDVVPLVKQCRQTQYDTYLDPLEQLSDRLLLLRKNAQFYAGHNQDDSVYSLVDQLFDKVMQMRRQMETAWQQGHCMQAVNPIQ